MHRTSFQLVSDGLLPRRSSTQVEDKEEQDARPGHSALHPGEPDDYR